MTAMTLRQVRRGVLDLTQVEFARMLGVSVRTLIRYEQRGAPAPVLKLAQHIVNERQRAARPRARSNT